MNAKLSIVLKSFEKPKLLINDVNKTQSFKAARPELPNTLSSCIAANKHQPYLIRLPKTRALFTVLRSPHIDKKSREQFEMKIRTQLIVINTEPALIRKTLFRLKLQNLGAVQYKIILNDKTRLKCF